MVLVQGKLTSGMTQANAFGQPNNSHYGQRGCVNGFYCTAIDVALGFYKCNFTNMNIKKIMANF
jgi:hypothetical protein